MLDAVAITAITTSAITLGAIPFPIGASAMTAVGAVAAIIQAILGGKSLDREILDQVNIVNNKMDQLSNAIRENNGQLRHLIVEHEFTLNVIVQVNTLDHLMRDVMKFPTNVSVEKFEAQLRLHDPHVLVINILNRLSYDSTNPLLSAMNADKYRTKNTFNIWRKTMNNLLGMLQIIHGFHEKLNDRPISSAAMENTISQVKQKLDVFTAEYKTDYWPHVVEQLMRETADNYQAYNNQHKAIHLHRKLNEIHTTDQFYVIVYDDCTGYHYHGFIGHASADSVSPRRLQYCCIAIAFTTTRGNASVPCCCKVCHTGAHRKGSLRDIMGALRDNSNFVALIAMTQHPHILYTGHHEPGRAVVSNRNERIYRYDPPTGKNVPVLRQTSDVLFVVGAK